MPTWALPFSLKAVVYGNKSSFPGDSAGEKPPANAGDTGDSGSSLSRVLIPGMAGNGNPLQYYFLENSMARGAWWRLWPMGSQRVGHGLGTEHARGYKNLLLI